MNGRNISKFLKNYFLWKNRQKKQVLLDSLGFTHTAVIQISTELLGPK